MTPGDTHGEMDSLPTSGCSQCLHVEVDRNGAMDLAQVGRDLFQCVVGELQFALSIQCIADPVRRVRIPRDVDRAAR